MSIAISMPARRVQLTLIYEKEDITADLAPHIMSWSYTDNASGKADDLQITLEDREGLWKGDWLPEKGATIWAGITLVNWDSTGGEESLPFGLFEIDEIECGGPPETVTIKAVSVPVSSALRGEDKSRAWEKTKLSVIANDIAQGADMELLFEADEDPDYDRIEQTEQSDLAFLLKLCEDAGLSLKVTDKQIVVFDDAKYEQMDPEGILERGVSSILSYRATSSTRDVYSSCRVKYHNAKKKQNIDYVYSPPNRPKTGKVLAINERVASLAEAEKLARKRLRQKNKDETKLTMTLLGDLGFMAGVTLLVVGFGAFDGKYFIGQATHNVAGGYTVNLDLRRVLEGY